MSKVAKSNIRSNMIKKNKLAVNTYGQIGLVNKDKKPKKSPYKMTLALISNIIIVSLLITIMYVMDTLLPEHEAQPHSVTLPLGDSKITENCHYERYQFADREYVASLIHAKIKDWHPSFNMVFEEPLPAHDEKEIDNSNNPRLFTDDALLPKVSPIIVIVIDDMGFEGYKTEDVIKLPPPLDLAFIPYVKSLDTKVVQAIQAGHEVMIHMPMQPLNPKVDSGPGTLRTEMGADEIKEISKATFDKFNYFSGVNNHMGSRFTADKKALYTFMEELKKEDVFFLDSKTTPKSVVASTAKELGIPFLERDVFIDNVTEEEAILKQLSQLEAVSRKRGYGIGIGHPHKATIQTLQKWIPMAKDKGFTFLTVGELIKYLKANPNNLHWSLKGT